MPRKEERGPRNGASELMEWRLSQANLDLEYLEEAKAEIVSQMRLACADCASPERCARDLASGDWEAGQKHYCPNAATIDELILGRR